MKTSLAFLTASLLWIQPLVAQDDGAAPAAPVAPPAEKKPGAASDIPADQRLELLPSDPAPLLPVPNRTERTEPLPLIPDAPARTEKPRGRAVVEPRVEKRSKTEAAADELQQRVRFREVKTRALKDPGVQSDWERAHTVRTDYEKREALKSYYTRLYAGMAKIDRSLKKRIAEERQRSLGRLAQTRVDPTEPLDPQERSERFGRD